MDELERLRRQQFITEQQPDMRMIWSARTPPHEYARDIPHLYSGNVDRPTFNWHDDKDPIFIGAAVVIISPSFEKPVVAQVAVIHDPDTDIALSVSGNDVLFKPMRARIDALTVVPHDIEPFSIIRVNKCPHRIDAEHAVMLADGNLANLVNCTYYVAVHTLSAQ